MLRKKLKKTLRTHVYPVRPNQFFIDRHDRTYDQLGEAIYVNKVIDQFRRISPPKLRNQNFVICSSNRTHPPGDFSRPKDLDSAILIYLSDDWSLAPPESLRNDYVAIFKCYLNQPSGNIFPFPLGYMNEAIKPRRIGFDQRQISVFFSGQINARRIAAIKGLLGWRYPFLYWATQRFRDHWDFSEQIPRSVLQFHNRGWARGMNGSEYIRCLGESKIALCPGGFHVEETFRHYEAMRAGCVVVAPKQSSVFLKSAPFVELDSYQHLRDTLSDLLADKKGLKDISRATVEYWKSTCSEEACGEYLAKCLRSVTG